MSDATGCPVCETLTQSRFYVGPASTTLVQHEIKIWGTCVFSNESSAFTDIALASLPARPATPRFSFINHLA